MENQVETNRKEFLRIISNFIFKINYHKEKCPTGKMWFDTEDFEWHTDPAEDYWDFDIEFNGYKVDSLIENVNNIQYSEYLESHFEKFKETHDISILKNYSKADCFNLLNEEIDLLLELKRFEQRYYLIEETEQSYLKRWEHNKTKIVPSESNKYDEDDDFIKICLSPFLAAQKVIIEKATDFLNKKLGWCNLATEQSFKMIPVNDSKIFDSNLNWARSDTDLLELVTALFEMKAINGRQYPLSRKESIEIFSNFFGREIKDAESKLSRATERKKDISPFLSSLKESFDNYAIKKEQK
jgi:hypothetical protein